jgi:hypothetical protein
MADFFRRDGRSHGDPDWTKCRGDEKVCAEERVDRLISGEELGEAGLHPTRGVRLHNRIWSKERITIKTILNRLRKLEEGFLPPVETEAGRRVREASEKLRQRMVAAEARLKALGYESPQPQVPELTESEQAALSGLTLGQKIRYQAQRHRDWIAEIDGRNTAAKPTGAVQS